MLTFPPIEWPSSGPVPLEVASLYGAETIAYSAEASRQAALVVIDLADAICPGFRDECKRACWNKGVAGMDEMGAYADAGRGRA